MSSGERSPSSGVPLNPADDAASMSAGRAAIETWWRQHRASLSPEHRAFLGHLVEQAELCLRLGAEAATSNETRRAADAGERSPDHAPRVGDGVESAGWLDLVRIWQRAAGALAGAVPVAPPPAGADESVRRCWHDYQQALGEYLQTLHSVSERTLNEAIRALREECAPGEERPLRSFYERLVETGEACYLEIASSEHYARLQARLVNSLLRFKRAQQRTTPQR